jgi:hypothetical protein
MRDGRTAFDYWRTDLPRDVPERLYLAKTA